MTPAPKGRRRRPPLPLGGRGAKRGGCNPGAKPDPVGRSAANRVWLFDLDNTLHDASHAAFGELHVAMGAYIETHLGLAGAEAAALRRRYWLRYGATMHGLVRHHGVSAAHFLEETHRLPGLEQRLRTCARDRAALGRLPGRKVLVTNAPRAYALRVIEHLGLGHWFDQVVAIEDMTMFGNPRPKPDARMLRRLAVRLRVPASRCVLVEDTLVHLKAARRVGMRGIWMQRYLDGRHRGPLPGGGNAGALNRREQGRREQSHRCAKPAYVYARIGALRKLQHR